MDPGINEKFPTAPPTLGDEKEVLSPSVDTSAGQAYDVPVSNVLRDGVKLHPQPTVDPLDPLNWSWTKKHTILGIVMFKYFMFTYITTTTVPSFPQLQESFAISYSQVNWTVAIPALGLAVGPLFWSSFAEIYGRRIVFILGTTIALASTIGAGGANSYGGYMAARFFQGFGASPAATVGMAVIGDLFFDYERGQKLGLWVLAIDSGLLVGPIIGGFMGLVSPEWIQWLTAIMFGALLILEVTFMSETLYPRTYMLARMPLASSSSTTDKSTASSPAMDIEKLDGARNDPDLVSVKRTTSLFFLNFRPVPGMRHPKPWDSCQRFILTFKYPIVVLSIFAYCFLWYWFILSIITILPVAYIDYKPQIQGLLFIGLLLGTLVSEIFCSGRLSDHIVNRLAKRNNGIRVPEMRLWLAYPATVLSAIGLIIWGVSIDQAYHWIVGQVAFFIFAAGIQMGNTVVTSYIVEAYPLQSMSVITFYSVFLNLSAFADPVSLSISHSLSFLCFFLVLHPLFPPFF